MAETVPNRFNLVDEKWIPIANEGLASLGDIFSEPHFTALGGNPTQKIALTKLLVAIAQAAYTPEDDEDWKRLGEQGMAIKARAYLEGKKDCFWLYGEKPFLQMPAVRNLSKKGFAALTPHMVAAGQNTSVLFQSQIAHEMTDAEKAVLVVHLMSFALGGKQVDNSFPLSKGYTGNQNFKGNNASGRAGSHAGYLHAFLQAPSIQESIWLNLFSSDQINQLAYFTSGIGKAPWECMPKGEDCNIARALKNSYMGTLIPMCRFLYLSADGIHNADGILYDRGSMQKPLREPDPALTYTPTVSVNRAGQKTKILMTNPNNRPWRQLTSLLSFLGNASYDCTQLRFGVQRVIKYFKSYSFSIWVGGMKFSDKGGEHAPRGTDDFVESEFSLESSVLGAMWFLRLNEEMSMLEELANNVRRRTLGFYKQQFAEGEDQAKQAANLFWQLAEHRFQTLINACGTDTADALRPDFARDALKAYDTYCPRDTARQLDAWSSTRPKLGKFFQTKTDLQPSTDS